MPHSHQRIALRRLCLLALITIAAATDDASRPVVCADDNVGRFPSRTTLTETPDEEIVAQAEAVEPLPPPLPTVERPTFTNPLDATPVYGWPGAEGQSAPAKPIEINLQAIGRLLLGDTPAVADPDSPNRYVGLGEPLHGTSWLNRPHYSGLSFGSMIADDLRNNAQLNNHLYLSLYHGWDFDHYHGTEFRIAGGNFDVFNSPTDSSAGIAFADANLLYYPWGDSRWRPYYSVGLGLAYFHVRDNANQTHNETLVHFPIGLGVKYQWQRHCAMRFDIKHNINFGGGGLDAMDHVSLSYGFEYRYGGRPKSYFPWNPSVHID